VNPFLFIVGCPRSGTTLLGRMLDAHPDIAVIHEGRWVADWYERRRGLTPDGAVTPALVERLLAHRPFENVAVERQDVERLAASADHLSYSRFISAVFDLHGESQGKLLVGEKTPHQVRSLPTLHALSPRAKIVHLIRDGRDVTSSVLNWPKVTERGGSVARFSAFREDPVTTVATWWEWLVRLGREDGSDIGAELYREVRYEDLVANPAQECVKLCEFLGVPFDGQMLRFHEGRVRTEPGLDAKKAWRPVTKGLRTWTSEFSPRDLDRFEAAAGDLLDELGYERAVSAPSGDAGANAARIRRSFSREVEARPHRRLPSRWPS
jgi:hypothetical protein